MKVRTLLANVGVALTTVAMTLVGVAVGAPPAAASAPSCRAAANPPDWYGYGTMPEGTGSTICTDNMSWVRVDLELDKATAAGWTPVGTDSLVVTDNSAAYWYVTTGCKGTGAANYVTKAKGSALWMAGVNQHLIKDPDDGSSYRWSSYTTLNCGETPPPPDPVDGICGAADSPRSSRSTAAPTGGRLPIC